MNTQETASLTDERIFRKLVESPFFQTYRKAFMDATDLDLDLVPADPEADAERQKEKGACHQSSFCQMVNSHKEGCQSCRSARNHLLRAAMDKPETATCFAGMRETMIPIRSGDRNFAMLSVGEIFTSKPGKNLPAELEAFFSSMSLSAAERKKLEAAWRDNRVMTLEQYQGVVTMLAAFALQLSDLLNRLLIEEANAEPEVVVNAKRFVNAHLEEKISLESVASHVGVSLYYFCKVFKQSAGMTLTEYVNRRRVECAKRRLLNPQSRVTEVAFDVGFQSISQFNRSFLKYVGESPTRYRERLATKDGLEQSSLEELQISAA